MQKYITMQMQFNTIMGHRLDFACRYERDACYSNVFRNVIFPTTVPQGSVLANPDAAVLARVRRRRLGCRRGRGEVRDGARDGFPLRPAGPHVRDLGHHRSVLEPFGAASPDDTV